MKLLRPISTLFPYTTLFRSPARGPAHHGVRAQSSMKELRIAVLPGDGIGPDVTAQAVRVLQAAAEDRKSTRLNSSHPSISYAVFCLKKKKKKFKIAEGKWFG